MSYGLNQPSPKGIAIGRVLAERVECPSNRMCGECVFRKGTFANGCEQTVMDALSCLVDPANEGVFRCAHVGKKPMPLCGGYIFAMGRLPSHLGSDTIIHIGLGEPVQTRIVKR
jgi:hypothetical protein